jgi:diacylglycerol kinase (ATP)
VVALHRELFDRIVLIYNPANPRIPRTLAEGVRDDLCRRLPDFPVTLQPTRFAGHAHELATAAAVTGRPLIVAVSGDGVYNEVVNGIMDVDGSSALSAVAAGGNANDHRRSTRRMPLVAAIVDGRARYLDLLRLTVRSSDVLWSRYAHSYIGFGLTPLMAIGLKKDKKGSRHGADLGHANLQPPSTRRDHPFPRGERTVRQPRLRQRCPDGEIRTHQ